MELGASMFPVRSSIRRKKDGRDVAPSAADRAELSEMDELAVREHCSNVADCGEVQLRLVLLSHGVVIPHLSLTLVWS